MLFRIKEVLLFENTFRMGSLVFGGGQVLVPMMEAQFVHAKGYLTATEFANGYGLLQAVPGPVFSFSTFVNGMALQEKGPMFQLLGCAIGSIGIFITRFTNNVFCVSYLGQNQIVSHHPTIYGRHSSCGCRINYRIRHNYFL